MHQRAGLVEMLGGKRDAELDRCQCESFLDHWAFCIESANLGASLPVMPLFLELLDQRCQQWMLIDVLAIVCGVTAFAVEVSFANLERVTS